MMQSTVAVKSVAKILEDAKVYQLFLHDILRHSGSGLVVLCAASLGKQRVVHLAENDRIGLVSFTKDNKTNLHCPALELLDTTAGSSPLLWSERSLELASRVLMAVMRSHTPS